MKCVSTHGVISASSGYVVAVHAKPGKLLRGGVKHSVSSPFCSRKLARDFLVAIKADGNPVGKSSIRRVGRG